MLQASKIPMQRLRHLDALWIQVAGTLCNLACTHCFVSAGPGVDRHGFMSRTEGAGPVADATRLGGRGVARPGFMPRAEVAGHVAEATRLGVREFYFPGGEPFLPPELLPILEDTLRIGPCTGLTTGHLV